MYCFLREGDSSNMPTKIGAKVYFVSSFPFFSLLLFLDLHFPFVIKMFLLHHDSGVRGFQLGCAQRCLWADVDPKRVTRAPGSKQRSLPRLAWRERADAQWVLEAFFFVFGSLLIVFYLFLPAFFPYSSDFLNDFISSLFICIFSFHFWSICFILYFAFFKI